MGCGFTSEEADNAEYPPHGLSKGVQQLPDWIKSGCGDKEYFCEEKGATFKAEDMPEKCPDLAEHNNFMTDALKANEGLYEDLKSKVTS